MSAGDNLYAPGPRAVAQCVTTTLAGLTAAHVRDAVRFGNTHHGLTHLFELLRESDEVRFRQVVPDDAAAEPSLVVEDRDGGQERLLPGSAEVVRELLHYDLLKLDKATGLVSISRHRPELLLNQPTARRVQ